MKYVSLKIFTVILLAAGSASAQNSAIREHPLGQVEVDRIVKKMTSNEASFREALTNYVFNRSATVQTVGFGGQITGTYRRDSFMTFNTDGARFEKITFFPMSTLTDIQVTPEDLEDLGGVNPFALEPGAVGLYNFSYLGKEKIDEIDLFVFDVAPKVMPDPKKSKQRLFTGRIWVDDRDLMIVKSKGKAVPETKQNKFPVVETWRDNIDGKYWFPSYSSSNDELVFDSGQVVRLRIKVTYSNYREAKSDVKILDDDAPTPAPKKP